MRKDIRSCHLNPWVFLLSDLCTFLIFCYWCWCKLRQTHRTFPFQTAVSTVCKCMYKVCVHAPECDCTCVCVLSVPYPCSSQLLKSSDFSSHEQSLLKLLSARLGAVHFPSQLAHKSYAKIPHWLFFPCEGSSLPQANVLANGDLLSGFIEYFILRRARSLSFYVNSSAFCPTPVWILICMWLHRAVGWGTDQAQKRKTILGVDVVFTLQSVADKDYHDLPVKVLLWRQRKRFILLSSICLICCLFCCVILIFSQWNIEMSPHFITMVGEHWQRHISLFFSVQTSGMLLIQAHV